MRWAYRGPVPARCNTGSIRVTSGNTEGQPVCTHLKKQTNKQTNKNRKHGDESKRFIRGTPKFKSLAFWLTHRSTSHESLHARNILTVWEWRSLNIIAVPSVLCHKLVSDKTLNLKQVAVHWKKRKKKKKKKKKSRKPPHWAWSVFSSNKESNRVSLSPPNTIIPPRTSETQKNPPFERANLVQRRIRAVLSQRADEEMKFLRRQERHHLMLGPSLGGKATNILSLVWRRQSPARLCPLAVGALDSFWRGGFFLDRFVRPRQLLEVVFLLPFHPAVLKMNVKGESCKNKLSINDDQKKKKKNCTKLNQPLQ